MARKAIRNAFPAGITRAPSAVTMPGFPGWASGFCTTRRAGDELVSDRLKMPGRLMGENITVRFDRYEALSGVEAGAGRFEWVLMNLSVNAGDAMPQGRRLTWLATITNFLA